MRIAIVEDNGAVRKALRRLLRAHGYHVEAYASGPDFLESLKTRLPDCVLLDVHMRPLGGLEVHVELNRRWPQVPVIFTSAVDDKAIRKRVLKQGAAAYLQKPLTEKVLLSVLAKIRPAK